MDVTMTRSHAMASIILKPTSKYWFAAFRDATGRQRRQTTGTTDKARAKRIADQYEAAAKRKGNPQKVRENFAALFKEFFSDDMPHATVRKFVTRWLRDRKQEITESTYVVYETTVNRFLMFLGSAADRDLGNVTKTQISDYRNGLAEKLAAETVNREIKIIKSIFGQARRDGYLFQDPAEGVSMIKRRDEAKRRRPLAVQEIQSILSVADPEWQSLIKFGLFTGQRLADLASLTWDQVDLQRGEIRLVTRKTGKRIMIPIAGPLKTHIDSLTVPDQLGIPVHPKAFATLKQHKKVSHLSHQFIDLMAQAGLRTATSHKATGTGRDGKRKGMDISFHSLRHSAVSLLKEAGVPDAVIQELVGHDSPAMSAHYTSIGKDSLTKAQEAMPKL
jgi:integrase